MTDLERERQTVGNLDKIIAQINKKLPGSATKLSDMPYKNAPRISTGSFALDIALGGGLVEGSIVEVFGEASTAKSLIALKTISEAQKLEKKTVYIDLEGSLDKNWATKVGVDPNKLILLRPRTDVEALDNLISVVSSRETGIVVLDSIAALVPKVETEESVEKQTMGVIARQMSKTMRILSSELQPISIDKQETYNPCIVILINQTREKIGVLYGNPLTTPGGKAVKFYSAIRIHTKRGEILRDDNKNIIGQEIKFQIAKNKTAKPYEVGAFQFSYTGEIDNILSVIQYAMIYDLIIRKGAYYYYGKERFQGKEAVVEFLKSKPEQIKKLKKDILAIVSK